MKIFVGSLYFGPFSRAWTSCDCPLEPWQSIDAERLCLQGASSYCEHGTPVAAHMLTHSWVSVQGLLPLYIHPQTGDATTQMVSLGAMGDSYYEYLLKVWIYKGRRSEDDMYRGMWERSMDEMLETLLFKNEESGYTYVAEFARCRILAQSLSFKLFAGACLADSNCTPVQESVPYPPGAAGDHGGDCVCSMSERMGDQMF